VCICVLCFCVCVCVLCMLACVFLCCVCLFSLSLSLCVCVCVCECGGQRTTFRSQCSPTIWVLGTKHWSSFLASHAFTCWAISTALVCIYYAYFMHIFICALIKDVFEALFLEVINTKGYYCFILFFFKLWLCDKSNSPGGAEFWDVKCGCGQRKHYWSLEGLLWEWHSSSQRNRMSVTPLEWVR